eukprot:Opistho-1_new@22691
MAEPNDLDGSTVSVPAPSLKTYEDALRTAHQQDYSSIERHKIISMAGVDHFSRPVIVFSACNMPALKEIDMNLLLQYIIFTLDKVVESDYVIVYLHAGLRSDARPTIGWIRQVYRVFDRKYKKNLKSLYIVHPTMFIRVLMGMVRPFISSKFSKKLQYIFTLQDLANHIHMDQLEVPDYVSKYDEWSSLSRSYKLAHRQRSSTYPWADLSLVPLFLFMRFLDLSAWGHALLL